MDTIIIILGILAILYAVVTGWKNNRLNNVVLDLKVNNSKLMDYIRERHEDVVQLQEEVGTEREKNRSLLSQKKSSETRLGQISEHLIPFLENCQHDPKNMHFLGNPIDYVVFDFDEGSITFLEVKSGNSKASKRQKTVKNIVKSGRVFYEEIRINEKGIRNRVVGTNDGPVFSATIKDAGIVALDEDDDDNSGQS